MFPRRDDKVPSIPGRLNLKHGHRESAALRLIYTTTMRSGQGCTGPKKLDAARWQWSITYSAAGSQEHGSSASFARCAPSTQR